MRFNKGILAILALFVVILSATAVSAIDDAGDVIAADEGSDDTDVVDDTDETDEGDDEATDEEADDEVDDEVDDDLEVGDNPYRHGEKTPNEKAMDSEANAADAAGASAKNPENAKVAAGSTATGNPLLVLAAAMAIIGTGFIRTRK